MISILTLLAGFVVPSAWAAFAGRGLAVGLLLAAVAVPYLKGRSDGGSACEERHEIARVAAEFARQAAEAAAAQENAVEDAAAAAKEVTDNATAGALLDPAKCVDGGWVLDTLSRLR